MANKRNTWFLNVVTTLTVVVCFLAFLAHYKNWTRTTPEKITIFSGIYYHHIPFANLDKVEWVEKTPPMLRLSGFSAFDKGKGVYQEFKDTLTDKKVMVFIDDYKLQKIRLVNNDSSQVYLNLKDSLATVALFEMFQGKLAATPN